MRYAAGWIGGGGNKMSRAQSLAIGRWYCIEARARLNDPGRSNGVFELWIDDGLEAQQTGLGWMGSYRDYGINVVYLENYWNDGVPQAQERYVDNFVVSTPAYRLPSIAPGLRSFTTS